MIYTTARSGRRALQGFENRLACRLNRCEQAKETKPSRIQQLPTGGQNQIIFSSNELAMADTSCSVNNALGTGLLQHLTRGDINSHCVARTKGITPVFNSLHKSRHKILLYQFLFPINFVRSVCCSEAHPVSERLCITRPCVQCRHFRLSPALRRARQCSHTQSGRGFCTKARCP